GVAILTGLMNYSATPVQDPRKSGAPIDSGGPVVDSGGGVIGGSSEIFWDPKAGDTAATALNLIEQQFAGGKDVVTNWPEDGRMPSVLTVSPYTPQTVAMDSGLPP